MTLAEQRQKLIDELGGEEPLNFISAAGFFVIGPEVTEEMLSAGLDTYGNSRGMKYIFLAMVDAGDLARKPE